jgi:hypothetical protein
MKYSGKYSLLKLFEDLNNKKIKNLIREVKSAGMSEQETVAAYLLDTLQNAEYCLTAPPKTHQPDVVAYDINDQRILQVEVKKTDAPSDGYAEFHASKTALVNGLKWVKEVRLVQIASGGMGSADQQAEINKRLLKASKVLTDHEEDGWLVIYGHPDAKADFTAADIKTGNRIRTLHPGTASKARADIISRQNAGTEGFTRTRGGGYGPVYSAVVLVKKGGEIGDRSIKFVDYPGEETAPGEWTNYPTPGKSIDKNGSASLKANARTKVENGNESSGKSNATTTPAKYAPTPDDKTYDQVMKEYYAQDGDNYFASVAGNSIKFVYIPNSGASDLLKQPGEFTPISKDGTDLSATPAGQLVDADKHIASTYRTSFTVTTSGVTAPTAKIDTWLADGKIRPAGT